MIPVVYIFGWFIGALALALVLPALVAAGLDEAALVPDFLITSVLLVFVAGAMTLSLAGRERRLRPLQRYVLALMLWALLPVLAGLPLAFALDEVSLFDAYFETLSALTTTGATVLGAPETLPQSIVFWLALLQWLGGALTLLVIVLVLAPTGVGGLPEAHQRLIEHGGLPEIRRLVMVFRDIMPLYAGATVACFALLAYSGLEPFDALCLAFASVSTGGVAPRSEALGAYVPGFGLMVLSVFMIYGATGVLWHRDLVRGRWAAIGADRENRWLVLICLTLGALVAGAFVAAGDGVGAGLRDGIFAATSLVTTTGLEARPASFAALPITLVLVVVAVGGASFSTAGGIKLFRIGAMLVQSGRELKRLVYPHAIRPARFGTQAYDMQVMKAIWSGFLAFLAAVAGLAWMVAADGVPLEGALLAALSMLSNAGPVYASNAAAGGWLAFADLSTATQAALCAGMVLGRLEIIAALALVLVAWRYD